MANSTHKQILDAVGDAIFAIPLKDHSGQAIPRNRVVVSWGVELYHVALPAVFVCPIGSGQVIGGTNERDDFSYPVAIYCVDRVDASYTPPMDTLLYWKEQVRKTFVEQRISGVSDVYICKVDPAPVLDVEFSSEYQLAVLPLTLRFLAREARL